MSPTERIGPDQDTIRTLQRGLKVLQAPFNGAADEWEAVRKFKLLARLGAWAWMRIFGLGAIGLLAANLRRKVRVCGIRDIQTPVKLPQHLLPNSPDLRKVASTRDKPR